MYQRVCNLEAIKAADFCYLVAAAIILAVIIMFADTRLPNFLYFNSDRYYQDMKRMDQLDEYVDYSATRGLSGNQLRQLIDQTHILGNDSSSPELIAERSQLVNSVAQRQIEEFK